MSAQNQGLGFIFTRSYRLGHVVKSCLKGTKGAAVATAICHDLKDSLGSYKTSEIYHDDLLVGLFIVQPMATLDAICGGDGEALKRGVRILQNLDARTQPLAVVPDDDLVAWCDQEPEVRYSGIASVIPILQGPGEAVRWTRVALRFLEKAPDPGAILRQFSSELLVSGGAVGTLAAKSELNATLLNQLGAYPHLSDVVAEQKQQLSK